MFHNLALKNNLKLLRIDFVPKDMLIGIPIIKKNPFYYFIFKTCFCNFLPHVNSWNTYPSLILLLKEYTYTQLLFTWHNANAQLPLPHHLCENNKTIEFLKKGTYYRHNTYKQYRGISGSNEVEPPVNQLFKQLATILLIAIPNTSLVKKWV